MRVKFITSIKKKKKKKKKKYRNKKTHIFAGKNVLPYFPLKNVQNTAKTY